MEYNNRWILETSTIMNRFDYIIGKYHLEAQKNERFIEIPDQTRETFASLIGELECTIGSEMGVEAGLYSEILCKANPSLELHCIDAWTAYKEYRDHNRQSTMDSLYDIAKKRLKPYNTVLHKGFSMDVVKDFPDNYFDFVYIDGNHEFKQVVDDVCEWTKKVKPGGIVAGHDYIRRVTNGYLMHVVPAINAYCDAYEIRPLFILGRKNAPPGEKRDRVRSWFFIKPDPTPVKSGSGNKILDLK